jgi:hypothetical protein
MTGIERWDEPIFIVSAPHSGTTLLRNAQPASGCARRAALVDAKVVRMPKAYPTTMASTGVVSHVFEISYTLHPTRNCVGRNGMHRYNNQDHSMLTGILAARNIMGASYDLWDLEPADGYLEDGGSLNTAVPQALKLTQPRVPERVRTASALAAGDASENS